MDEVPACPHCGGASFKRGSIFGDRAPAEPSAAPPAATPEWLPGARDALVEPGDYVAYEDGERVRVVPLREGWTRLGRSLSAHVRFDDPTVSRRHALIHSDGGTVRVLDDRSLNGVFLNGERVEWHEMADGDRITIVAFDMHYIRLTGPTTAGRWGAAAAGAG